MHDLAVLQHCIRRPRSIRNHLPPIEAPRKPDLRSPWGMVVDLLCDEWEIGGLAGEPRLALVHRHYGHSGLLLKASTHSHELPEVLPIVVLPNINWRTTTRLGDEELIVEHRPRRNPHGSGEGIALPDHPTMHDLVVFEDRSCWAGRLRDRLPSINAPDEPDLLSSRDAVGDLLRDK
jgi:hypothetical protein